MFLGILERYGYNNFKQLRFCLLKKENFNILCNIVNDHS